MKGPGKRAERPLVGTAGKLNGLEQRFQVSELEMKHPEENAHQRKSFETQSSHLIWEAILRWVVKQSKNVWNVRTK